jgi:methionyl-tRNA formyltransferase
MNLGVLVGGNLGLTVLKHLFQSHNIKFVLTDKKSFLIIEFCKTNDIEIFIGNPRTRSASIFFLNFKIEVLISINYLFLIERDLIELPSKIAFNIHGSLLPKYRGRTPHVWAIINNENQTGITAHIIDENCDAGDIISQIKIPINKRDTGADILIKYKLEYYNLVKEVLEKLKKGKLELTKQDENFATYFGKRTAEDGKINWNWKKERIVNWIRAQAFPYPGAFSHVKDQKIVIDEVEEVILEVSDKIKSGIILAVVPNIIVNTSNGALKLTKLREKYNVNIGDRLN